MYLEFLQKKNELKNKSAIFKNIKIETNSTNSVLKDSIKSDIIKFFENFFPFLNNLNIN